MFPFPSSSQITATLSLFFLCLSKQNTLPQNTHAHIHTHHTHNLHVHTHRHTYAKLTQLIPELADILENRPKQLNLACAELIADYDAESQRAFIEMCTIEGNPINKATVRHIVSRCPPPTATKQAMFNAWHESQAAADAKRAAPPKKISFDRKRFAPYLDKLGSEQKLEDLFLEFLRERAGA